jgi:tRNA(Arg) A34 adenosine deaminase TadA
MIEPIWSILIDEAWRSYLANAWGVGALAVDGSGSPIKKARNQARPNSKDESFLWHAEVRLLSKLLPTERRNGTIMVTMEPCILCLGALTYCRVGRVLYAARDFSFSSAQPALRRAPILGPRVPQLEGPLFDATGIFCRVISLIAEIEHGFGRSQLGLERYLAPRLVKLTEELIHSGLFQTARAAQSDWRPLYNELELDFDGLINESLSVEQKLRRLGIV